MKIIKKIVNILMTTILMFSMVSMFNNESKATTYLINEANLYSKGEMISFRHKSMAEGMAVGVQYVVYKKDGIEYPAYCLNRDLVGVTTESGAKVTVNKAVSNSAVWRAVTNGYPFKTPSELNCKSEIEAFAATKMAVYDALYTYNWSDFEPLNEQGKRVLAAAENISKKARSSSETKLVGKVEIKEITDTWEVDDKEEQYISKIYKVCTNVESTKYKIQLSEVNIDNIKIVDKNNKEKTEFNSNDNFKILIPISQLEEKSNIKREFKINATADLKTKPILYGETADSNYQNYALAAGDWEFETAKIKVTYPSNKTKIKISKIDKETKEPLAYAKFNILDKNKSIVYSDIITDKNGNAQIDGILPGKYYIEEIIAPDGYTKYDELIEIDVDFNETYTVYVNNHKKPEDTEKEIESKKEKTVVGKKEVKLPRTGF